MKIQWLGFLNKKKITQSQNEEPVKILEARESEDKACLRVAMEYEFYNDLLEFLKPKRDVSFGHEKEAISLLLEYGLSEESREELERIKNEIERVGSHYAAMCFQTYEYYAKNNAITMGLRLHLQENKSLKRELKERGLGGYASADEWDKWDDNFIDGLYRRYVFCK